MNNLITHCPCCKEDFGGEVPYIGNEKISDSDKCQYCGSILRGYFPDKICIHKKGGIYFIQGIARNSETLEETVIYTNSKGEFWNRPKEMFYDGRFKPLK